MSLSSLLELTLPNCSTRSSGCASWTAVTASLVGSSRFAASSESPVISNVTRAECWSTETGASPVNGEVTSRTSSVRDSRAVASSIVAVNSGSSTSSVLLWIRRCSVFGLRPASYSVCSARPASPENWSAPWIWFLPTALPTTTATTTKASQPKIAVLRWLALQCAARAARLRDLFTVSPR